MKIHDRITELEQQIAELKNEVCLLKQEILRLNISEGPSTIPLLQLLAQRGLSVLQYDRNHQLLLPSNATVAAKDAFYNLLRRYSFRLFLRDLIQYPKDKSIKKLCRYCSPSTARSYLKKLVELGIADFNPRKGYSLRTKGISSFGPTLEWYVGQVFSRHFSAPVITDVKFKNTATGGDYDVIALLDQKIVYVEVKSSPPRGVEKPAIRAFLDRLNDLQPDVALFLVDTELRMKDKMVVLFSEEMERRFGRDASRRWQVARLVDELFQINHGIYILNSKRGIVANIQRCLQDFNKFYRRGKVQVPWDFRGAERS